MTGHGPARLLYAAALILFVFFQPSGLSQEKESPEGGGTPSIVMTPCDRLLTDDLFLMTDISPKELFQACYEFSKEKLASFHAEITKTIDHSRKHGGPAIIIDKAAYKLNMVNGGKVTAKYDIELGFNPYNQKTRQGDYCTPEGLYRIEAKKEGDGTKYFKALLINYPNADDRSRFRQLKRSGEIGESDKIGGLIEIHGKGTGMPGNDGGVNWTLGCVALSDDDITAVYDKVSVGTPVLIVKYGANRIGYLKDVPEMKYLLD